MENKKLIPLKWTEEKVIANAKKMNIDLSLTKKSLKLYNKLAKSKFKNDDTSSILKLI